MGGSGHWHGFIGILVCAMQIMVVLRSWVYEGHCSKEIEHVLEHSLVHAVVNMGTVRIVWFIAMA